MTLRIIASVLALLFLSSQNVQSQCNNPTQWPTTVQQVPFFKLEFPIASQIFAGEHTLATGWRQFQNYVVTSSLPDYISIYTTDDQLVAHGPSPLTFYTNDIVSSDSLKISFNLISPPCGSDDVGRQPVIECATCPSASNVGIGNIAPHQSAILDLTNYASQGLLLPSVTSVPGAPAATDGLLLYQQSTDEIRLHADGGWTTVATKADISEQLSTPQQLTIPSAAFVPMSSSAEHGFSFTRGKYSNGASLIAPLVLPEGATINSLTYCYYDNDSNLDANIRLYYNLATSGTSTSTAIFDTSGAANSIRTANIPNVEEPIRANNNYFILFNPESTALNNNIAIKAVTVYYTPQ